MATYETFKKLQSGAAETKGAMKELQTYSKEVTELAETTDLSKFQNAFKGVKIFGKLSTALTAANMGLELAMFAIGKPDDPNKVILDAVRALDNKVTGMWNAMNVQFDRIHAHLDDTSAKQNIQQEIKNFASLNDLVQLYQQSDGSATYNKLLRDDKYDPADILSWLSAIRGAVVTSDAALNPLKASFNYTNGDAAAIAASGSQLMRITVLAPMAYRLCEGIRHVHFEEDNPLSTEDEFTALFQEHIDDISDACQLWLSKCEDPTVVKQNVTAKLYRLFAEPERGHKPVIESGRGGYFQYYPAAKQLCGILQKQWYWFDWLVVISEGGEGNNPEQVASTSENWVTANYVWISTNVTVSVTVAWSPLKLEDEMAQPLQDVAKQFPEWEEKNTGIKKWVSMEKDPRTGLYESSFGENDLGQIWRDPSVRNEFISRTADNIFAYCAKNSHNFSAYWTNPDRVYFATWMGQEPANDQDDIRKNKKLPAGHIVAYGDHALFFA